MTDLEQFKAMLSRCGHAYEEQGPENVVFYVGAGRDSKPVSGMIITLWVVGTFYDELRVYFDPAGNLLEMQSHVAYSNPATRRLREYLGVLE